jgi:hypothetical protein
MATLMMRAHLFGKADILACTKPRVKDPLFHAWQQRGHLHLDLQVKSYRVVGVDSDAGNAWVEQQLAAMGRIKKPTRYTAFDALKLQTLHALSLATIDMGGPATREIFAAVGSRALEIMYNLDAPAGELAPAVILVYSGDKAPIVQTVRAPLMFGHVPVHGVFLLNPDEMVLRMTEVFRSRLDQIPAEIGNIEVGDV